MNRSIIGVALALSLFLAPLAYADTAPVPIGDPYTDTLKLWSEIASAISSLANDFATLFNDHEVPSTNAPSNSQQGSASLAATVASFNSPPQTLTSATSSSTTTNTTSDQTTLSQNVKSAQSTAPANSTILSGPTPAFDASDFVTQSELTQTLLALSNSLADKSAPTTAPVFPEWVAADGNPFVPYAAVSNIGQLSNVTITNANLSASEIPALDYLPLSGGTLTGTLSVPTLDASSTNYGVITSANASSTNLSNFGTAYFGGTGTTTIDSAGDLSVAGNTSLVNATSSNLSVSGTASTSNFVVSNSFTLGTLTGILHAAGGVVSASLVNLASDVSGVLPVTNGGTGWASLTSGYIPFGNGSSGLATSTNLFFDAIDGRLGVGTSSPFATLSVNGSGYFSTLNLGSALSIANGGTGATTTTGVTASIQFLQSTSTAVARTVQSKLSDTISVKDFGATGNALSYSDGTITSGTNAFSSNSATFTSADVGKVIWIDFAGSSSQPLQTTITGFTDAHHVTLGADAVTSVPYSFLKGVSVATAQSGSGSYAPGDTITLSGGTATTPAVVTVWRTDVVSATLASGGTGGKTTTGASSGSCVVTGTTGSGERLFSLNVTLTSGAITSVTSIASAGEYSANPTSLSAEPVTGCGSLSGATVSLVMGVLMPIVTTQGKYSATATTLTQASTSGSGSGATFSPDFVTGGTFTYGTDDTQSWTNAINYVSELDQSGAQTCLYAPAGYYLITSSLPTFYHASGCIKGDGSTKTYLRVAPSLSGDVFSFSEDWIANSAPFGSPTPDTSSPYAGLTIEGVEIMGDQSSPNLQYGVTFYDRNDLIDIEDVSMDYLTASCMRTGVLKNSTQSYIRESQFNNIHCWNSGTSTAPAIDINTNSMGDGTNEVDFDTINIYAPNGPGFVIRSAGTSGTGTIRVEQLRVEGQEGDIGLYAGDLVRVGDSSLSGIVSDVHFDELHLVNPYLGYAAMRVTADTSADQPYTITVTNGDVTAAPGFGRGLEIDAGRDNSFNFSIIPTLDYNLYVGASPLVGSNNNVYVNGDESSLYSYIASSSVSAVSTSPSYQTINSLSLYNTATGINAFSAITTGTYNTAFGYNAGAKLLTSTQDTFIGAWAGQSQTTGNGDTYIGYAAGQAGTTGFNNTCLGASSCYQNVQGNQNVAIGTAAGYNLTTGSTNNVILGMGFGTSGGLTTAKDTIEIGDGLQVLPQTAYAQLDIGNLVFGTGLASTTAVSTGDLSIGTSSPSSRLTVWGADAASSTSAFAVVNSASTTVFSVFDGGNAELSGSLSQSSDQRLKTNIQSLGASSSLSLIDELNPVTFNWIDPNQTTALQLGFIAQQVQQIFPNLVSTTSATALTPGGTLSLNYIGLISPIVSAIQALDQEISDLTATVAGFAQSFTTHILTGDDVTANRGAVMVASALNLHLKRRRLYEGDLRPPSRSEKARVN